MLLKRIIPLTAALALGACVSTTQPTQSVSTSNTAVTSQGGSFSTLLNDFRASEGRRPVQRSAALDRAAKAHATDMVQRGYFSHQSPGGPNGARFIDRSRSAGCQSRSGAENIATGQRSEAAVIEAWKNSAGHRRNMLGANYTLYGLGRTDNIWVLVFSTSC